MLPSMSLQVTSPAPNETAATSSYSFATFLLAFAACVTAASYTRILESDALCYLALYNDPTPFIATGNTPRSCVESPALESRRGPHERTVAMHSSAED